MRSDKFEQTGYEFPWKKILSGVAVVLLLIVGRCSIHRVKPDAGFEAVLVEQPIFFGHGGVAETPVTTGSTWVAGTTAAVMVNIQPQQFNYEFDDLMSSNGIPLKFNATLRLQVTDSVDLIKRFGPNWRQNNIDSEFSSEVRQEVRNHDMNSLAITSEGIDKVDTVVAGSFNEYLKRAKLPVRLIKVTVGKATPPQDILNQRTATAAQDQRAQTELSTKRAEDNRKMAEASRAEADNAYRNGLGLNPQEFVELQRIDMQKQVCTKGGCTFIVGNGNPVINTNK